jgi:D-tyrosyl-tRNA(Tyr) deacylase
LRAVLQRVTSASVTVEGEPVAAIGHGLLIMLGVAADDNAATAERMAVKCAEMRVFSDQEGRFNRSLLDVRGAALVVSQFTLLADARTGRRPSFTAAASPEVAAPLVDEFAESMRKTGVTVATGEFAAHMTVALVNDGPVTIVLDSEDMERPRRH